MKIVAIALLCLSACATAVNPQMKTATDARLSAIRSQSRTLTAPKAYQPMPWAVGQWVVMRSVDDAGEPSVMRVAVVSKDADGFWLEIDTQDYRHRTVSKVQYARQPRSVSEAMDVVRKVITTVDEQKPVTYDFTKPDPTTALMRSTVQSGMSGPIFPERIEPSSLEDAVVAAGTFRACAHALLTTRIAFVQMEYDACFHPAVPVNGIVRGKYRGAGHSSTVELLDYGLTGASGTM